MKYENCDIINDQICKKGITMLDIDSTLLKRYDNIEHNIQKGVALYGAGQNGRWCLRYLRNCGFDVKCFYDSAADKIKRYVDDIPVIEWLGSSDYVVLVTAKHCVQEILDKIDEDNVMSFDAWFIIRNLNPYDELQFEDEKSNKVKIAVQKAMLSGNEEQLCEVVSNRQYFCLPQFWGRINETFVDLGAYVGDTVEKFIQEHNGCFDKIYAFEPGEKQNRALRYRCDRMKEEWALPDDKIVIEKMVVGGEKGIVNTNPNSYLQSLSFGQINRGGESRLRSNQFR